MTIKQVITEGMKILQGKIESALLETQVILAYLIKKDRVYLISHNDEVISSETYHKFIACISKRAEGIPLQYITGKQEFMSLDFYVDSSVLIPRPETEILVEEALKYIKNVSKNGNVHILDIGTGSGCISISILHKFREASVTAVDISKDALLVAGKNAGEHGVSEKIHFIESNIFQGLNTQKFDVIVSNPPYVRTKTIQSLQREVKDYEPMYALDGGEDGLDCIRKIIHGADGYLKTGGFLALEIGHDQADEVISLIAERQKFKDIRTVKDYSGIDRIVTAVRL